MFKIMFTFYLIVMIVLSIFVANLVVNAAEVNTEFCDMNKICKDEIEYNYGKKQIFYDVNPQEGFNLRRDVYMRFAITLAEAQKYGNDNWELVLPPWYNLLHWKNEIGTRVPKPWAKYFDIDSLKSFAPVVEMLEVFSNTQENVLEIDVLYVLENYENAFENGVFEEKWKIVTDCRYNGGFWGYNNITVKETICVKFQGKNSKLRELIALHPRSKRIMFSNGEIPLHDSYGTKTYWDCRKSMKFNKDLVMLGEQFVLEDLNCTNNAGKCDSYLSVHWRRQDFAISHANDVPSVSGTKKQIHDVLQKLNLTKVFISTDASHSELHELESGLMDLGYEVYLFMISMHFFNCCRDGSMAVIDQIVASHAAYFIGTHESTFTYRIQEEREILGFDSSTTFNRLCPDTGYCEPPSKWTIVN